MCGGNFITYSNGSERDQLLFPGFMPSYTRYLEGVHVRVCVCICVRREILRVLESSNGECVCVCVYHLSSEM